MFQRHRACSWLFVRIARGFERLHHGFGGEVGRHKNHQALVIFQNLGGVRWLCVGGRGSLAQVRDRAAHMFHHAVPRRHRVKAGGDEGSVGMGGGWDGERGKRIMRSKSAKRRVFCKSGNQAVAAFARCLCHAYSRTKLLWVDTSGECTRVAPCDASGHNLTSHLTVPLVFRLVMLFRRDDYREQASTGGAYGVGTPSATPVVRAVLARHRCLHSSFDCAGRRPRRRHRAARAASRVGAWRP